MATETTDAEVEMIREALRFAVWAAGEGLCPADGEDAEAPEDFLFAYSQASGVDDWDTLPERVAAALARPEKDRKDG